MDLQTLFENIDEEWLRKTRRTLHMYPETGFDLPRTVELVTSQLRDMGIPYTGKYGQSSVVATINGHKRGFTIGIRADMDALPVQEAGETSYKSRYDGKMHACGHDAHTAILLGVAKLLDRIKEDLNCRVVLLFQPSEEGIASGAKSMVEDGVMDDIDIIIGCHMDNAYDVGTVGFLPGAAMASCHDFRIELRGKSGHAVFPHTAVDAITMGMRIYTALELMMNREIDPFALRVMNIGSFHAGTAKNVVADHCRMEGTVRTHSEEVAKFIMRRADEIVHSISREMGGEGCFTVEKYLPAVVNDPFITSRLMASAEKTVGKENVVVMEKPKMSSEDFAFYQTRKPGVFFRIGSRNEAKGIVSMPHRNDWDIDEDALSIAVRVFVQFVADSMNGL